MIGELVGIGGLTLGVITLFGGMIGAYAHFRVERAITQRRLNDLEAWREKSEEKLDDIPLIRQSVDHIEADISEIKESLKRK